MAANQPATPKQQSTDRLLNQAHTWIIQNVRKLQGNPINGGNTLTSQALVSGVNTINTGLNRTLVGWFIVRQRGPATIYDLQDTNTNPTNHLDQRRGECRYLRVLMPTGLQTQTVAVPFGQGIDSKTDPKQVKMGSSQASSNAVFTAPSQIKKRYGNTAIGIHFGQCDRNFPSSVSRQ